MPSKPRSVMRLNAPRFSIGGSGRSKYADIIGVNVRDSTADTPIATLKVTANSRKSRPMTPPMNSNGISTATSDTVKDTIVKPICRLPISAASKGDLPSSMCRAMFSIMTIASSTTKPVEIVSAMSDRLSRL